ncbi:MAG TPA: histidine kinase [Nocardioidaceae bacterium]|jgi:two-component system sensor histidine kinase DesK|nr:histidine kinase [Nocardioidaceae bacterium]
MTESGAWTFRDGRAGRLGILFAAVWLVFLADPVQTAWDELPGLRGWLGLLSTFAFAAVYLVVFAWLRRRRMRLQTEVEPARAVAVIGTLLALMLLMCLAVGQPGTAAAVYLAVVAVMYLPTRQGVVVAVTLAVGAEVAAALIPGWERGFGLSFAICTAAFAMWGVQQLMLRNVDLMRAREENARLAVEKERNRFARDLHDILGHSLTVITVKAELASRLFDTDRERARAELADLERLSRDALADVRRAVEGYRELTLPGELARARAALEAADIEADVPNSTDEVPSELRELFAWTVREGVTNVIRHSGASCCIVRLGPDRVEVRDDGSGHSGGAGRGHGLAGLRERAAAVNAVVMTRPLEPRGFELQVCAQ